MSGVIDRVTDEEEGKEGGDDGFARGVFTIKVARLDATPPLLRSISFGKRLVEADDAFHTCARSAGTLCRLGRGNLGRNGQRRVVTHSTACPLGRRFGLTSKCACKHIDSTRVQRRKNVDDRGASERGQGKDKGDRKRERERDGERCDQSKLMTTMSTTTSNSNTVTLLPPACGQPASQSRPCSHLQPGPNS